MEQGKTVLKREYQEHRNSLHPDIMVGNPNANGADLFVKWQLDTKDYLEKLKHQIQGMVYDYKKKEWFFPMVTIFDKKTSTYKKVPRRFLNEEGAMEIWSYLDIHFTHFNKLSKLEDDEIHRLCGEARQWIVDLVYVNHEKFDIAIERADTLVHFIDHTVFPHLKGSLKGFQAELLSMQQRIVETVNAQGYQNPDAQKKKKGIFNIFKSTGG
jgi:hypothetical protein